MKRLLLLSATLLASGLCSAQEIGRVISATPIVEQVGVPRQVCSTEQVAVQQPKSGAGAVMGAVAGGAMGNAVGGGSGKAAATMIGIIGGAIVGDRIEGAPQTQFQNVQRCGTQTFYESRPVAYNVVYEYAGKQYSVQMPNDPGPTIRLQVSPVSAGPSPQPPYTQGAYTPPTNVVLAPAVIYSGYYVQPYYPPVSIQWGHGHWERHRGHHHWR